MSDKLTSYDISTEQYREYDFNGRVYKIDNPTTLYIGSGKTTHRVVDEKGVVHCVPAPGLGDCVLRWSSKNKNVPVNF